MAVLSPFEKKVIGGIMITVIAGILLVSILNIAESVTSVPQHAHKDTTTKIAKLEKAVEKRKEIDNELEGRIQLAEVQAVNQSKALERLEKAILRLEDKVDALTTLMTRYFAGVGQ